MTTIYGTFTNTDSADRALTKLEALNYDPKEISLIATENITTKEGTEAGKGAKKQEKEQKEEQLQVELQVE